MTKTLGRYAKTRNTWLAQASGIIMEQAYKLSNYELTLDQLSVRRLTTLYFVASHLYYSHDVSLLHDTVFDKLCAMLSKEEFDGYIYNKPNKDDLEAGTGYSANYSIAIIKLSDYIKGSYEKQTQT